MSIAVQDNINKLNNVIRKTLMEIDKYIESDTDRANSLALSLKYLVSTTKLLEDIGRL